MIKAKATGVNGQPIFVLGISEENVLRLKDGKPIIVQLGSMGGHGELCIMYGQTEAAIADELADLIGPQTEVRGVIPGRH